MVGMEPNHDNISFKKKKKANWIKKKIFK